MPVITALMSVYNGDQWLNECIQSVLNQSFKDFEFLIIDDGSTDKTLMILEEFAKNNERIKIISQDNIGLTKSLAKGVSISKGKWIARIDCDDLCEPNRFKDQYSYAIKNKCHLIGSYSKYISASNKFSKETKCPIIHKKLLKNLISQKQFFAHSSSFFLKESALEIGNYRDTLKSAQDYDLWLRFAEKYKIGCLPEVKVFLRKHSGSISNINNGISQKVDAHISLVSYFIRQKKNFQDPLDPKLNYFIFFKEFVFKQLSINNHIEYFQKKFEYDSIAFDKGFKLFRPLLKIIYLFRIFKSCKVRFLLIRRILFGSFIASKIATKWTKYINDGCK